MEFCNEFKKCEEYEKILAYMIAYKLQNHTHWIRILERIAHNKEIMLVIVLTKDMIINRISIRILKVGPLSAALYKATI